VIGVVQGVLAKQVTNDLIQIWIVIVQYLRRLKKDLDAFCPELLEVLHGIIRIQAYGQDFFAFKNFITQ
jgi:hypothetical protein